MNGALLQSKYIKVKTGYVPEKMGTKVPSVQSKVKPGLKEIVSYHDSMFRTPPRPIETLDQLTSMMSMIKETDIHPVGLHLPNIKT